MNINARVAGSGDPVLLIHGGAEDLGMLDAQADALVECGFRVLWYDRRGTGGSTRDDWPDGGVERHADDAAALLTAHGMAPATVLGFSSGGVVALALAARRPEVATEVVAWEPAALGMLPDGATVHAAIMEPIEAYLAEHPDDWTGAWATALMVLSEGRADLDAPEVKRAMLNAEAAVRDDGRVITRRGFVAGELPAGLVTVAVSQSPNSLHLTIAERVGELVGRPPVRVTGAEDHEVYLHRPEIIARWLAGRRR